MVYYVIAENDNISLSLSANLNVHVRLEISFGAIEFSTTINELNMAFLAKISDTFDVTIAEFGDLLPHQFNFVYKLKTLQFRNSFSFG